MDPIQGVRTTEHSNAEERMKVDAYGKKRSILKRLLKKKSNRK